MRLDIKTDTRILISLINGVIVAIQILSGLHKYLIYYTSTYMNDCVSYSLMNSSLQDRRYHSLTSFKPCII